MELQFQIIMKKYILSIPAFLCLIIYLTANLGCQPQRGNVCIQANADTVAVNASVKINSCGDEVRTDRITVELDWGDGTISSGQTGSHAYNSAGTYIIRVLVNGEAATEIVDADPEDVEVKIVVE